MPKNQTNYQYLDRPRTARVGLLVMDRADVSTAGSWMVISDTRPTDVTDTVPETVVSLGRRMNVTLPLTLIVRPDVVVRLPKESESEPEMRRK
jgi:hypothetical protein